MNINHAVEEKIEGDLLKAIFDRQKSLMGKYHDIELKSGLLQTEDCPVNLDDKRGQARIKDFSWRVTEELGEALDAKVNTLIKVLKFIISESGFELGARIELRDKKTGRRFR